MVAATSFGGRLWSLNWSACIFDFLPFHVTLKYHICYWQPIALNLLNKIYDYCLGSSLPSFLPLFLCQFPTLIYLVIGNIFSLAVIVNYFFFFFFCNLCSHRNYSGICLFLVWKILSIFYRPTFVTSQECRGKQIFPYRRWLSSVPRHLSPGMRCPIPSSGFSITEPIKLTGSAALKTTNCRNLAKDISASALPAAASFIFLSFLVLLWLPPVHILTLIYVLLRFDLHSFVAGILLVLTHIFFCVKITGNLEVAWSSLSA